MVFVVNQILVRIGGIFKNETAIIPRFLELHSPSGVICGFLPLIFGLGQSLPLFLIALNPCLFPAPYWRLRQDY